MIILRFKTSSRLPLFGSESGAVIHVDTSADSEFFRNLDFSEWS